MHTIELKGKNTTVSIAILGKGKIMKKLIIICTLALSGCANVIASNEKSITIVAPPVAAAQAFQKADEHCKAFGKSAVPSGTVYGNATVFKCE